MITSTKTFFSLQPLVTESGLDRCDLAPSRFYWLLLGLSKMCPKNSPKVQIGTTPTQSQVNRHGFFRIHIW